MKGSGLEDLEPTLKPPLQHHHHRHLQQMQPVSRHLDNPLAMADEKLEFSVAGSTNCMPNHDEDLTHSSRSLGNKKYSDLMEGADLTSSTDRHGQQAAFCKQQVTSSPNRHSSEELDPKRLESTAVEPFRERPELLTHQEHPDLAGARLADKLSDKEIQQGMELCSRSRTKLLDATFNRTCRICNKQFTSGRALGGHMRVHGPLFTATSLSTSRSSAMPVSSYRETAHADVIQYGARNEAGSSAMDFTQRKDGRAHEETLRSARNSLQEVDQDFGQADVNGARHEEETTPSVVDALDAGQWQEDAFLRGNDLKTASSCMQGHNKPNPTEKSMAFSCDNSSNGDLDVVLYDNGHLDGAGEADELNSMERRSLSVKSEPIHEFDSDGKRVEANSATARKSPLYKLRNNPKRSRLFIEQEFAFGAPKNHTVLKHIPPRGEVGATFSCSECGKTFSSERALFGHLRCHPDRYKRGMSSPESSSEQPAVGTMAGQPRKQVLAGERKLTESSEIQGLHKKGAPVVDVLMGTQQESPQSISAGVKVMSAEAFIGDEESEFEEQDGCINSLDMLSDDVAPARWHSAGKRSRRKVMGLSKAGSIEIRDISSLTPEDEPALTSETISLELGIEEQEIGTPDFLILLAEAAQKIEEAEVLAISTEKYSHLLKNAVKRSNYHQMDAADLRREDYVDADALPVQSDPCLVVGDSIIKYECTTCKKSFNSHQALGGHRASHKKTKGCFARTGSSEASEEHSFDEEQLELNPHGHEKGTLMKKKKKQLLPMPGASFKGHACSICHRVFLTGQALGGHKRCHWTGEKPSEMSTSLASTTNKQPSMHYSEGQSMVEGGIDLNMPAPMDDMGADEIGFDSTDQIHMIDSDSADRDFDVGRDAGSSLELVLGTSALDQTVQDLWKVDADMRNSSPQRATNEADEARHRFDEMWGQHWPNENIGVTYPQLHQAVYAMQSLV